MLGAVIALSSCSTVDPPAATVNGTDISMADFESAAEAVQAYNLSQQGTDSTEVSTVPGELARRVLTVQIELELAKGELARLGTPLTDEQRADEETALAASSPQEWEQAPEAFRSLLVELNATQRALDAAVAPDEAELAATYDQGITASGYACVSHILVETEEEAIAVLDRLDAGEDFAALAAEVSIDPSGATTGGVITGQDGSPCIPLTTFEASFVPEFVEGATAAAVGEPTEPVQSQFSYHIILVRPFDDVKDQLLASAGATAAETLRTDLARDADVSVNRSVGVWSSEAASVVAPSAATGS